MPYRELLLGCGYRRIRLVDPYRYQETQTGPRVREEERWQHVTTVDHNPECKPDFCLDLNTLDLGFVTLPQDEAQFALLERAGNPFRGSLWRFRSNTFEEIHAYEVLEHLGQQGNAAAFFRDFAEIWRLLTPGGFLCATVPSRFSPWLWGDPGHTRAILPAHLLFLHRPHYDTALRSSASSDYRSLYPGDFDILHTHDNEETHTFVLQAVKPIRPPPAEVRS
jgi:hypothetical protein